MSRVSRSRGELPGLLVRAPWAGDETGLWPIPVVDPIQQIEELAELRNRGLLSSEEFEEHKARVLRPHVL